MKETSSRMILVAVCAWVSACLLISGWLPDLGEGLRVVWLFSGLTGLVASVGLAEVVKRDILTQQSMLKEYMEAAATDGLTGLANRQAFDKALTKALSYQNLRRSRLSLLMIDVDCFKLINDTFGHQGGDEVLRSLARTATGFFQGKGGVARYGGEELAVALPGYRLREAMQVANEFRELIHAHPCSYQNQSVVVTVSIGAAEACPGEKCEELIHRADMALYSAKRMGRNCAWFADPCTESAVEMILDAVTARI